MGDDRRVTVGEADVECQVSRVDIVVKLDYSFVGLLELSSQAALEVFRMPREDALGNLEGFASSLELDDLVITSTQPTG